MRSYYLAVNALAFLALLAPEAKAQFGPEQVLAAQRVTSVFVTDMDMDGDADILFSSQSDSSVSWLRSADGTGSFGPALTLGQLDSPPTGVHATDLNGDDNPDVLFSTANAIYWSENLLGGIFSPPKPVPASEEGLAGASSVRSADLDGDGDQDVLSFPVGYWYENMDGLGTFGAEKPIPGDPSNFFAISQIIKGSADLDGDGDVDVLGLVRSYDNAGRNGIAWFENDGAGGFTDHPIDMYGSPDPPLVVESFVPLDVDSDGDSDVVVGLQPSIGYSVPSPFWYENVDGKGAFNIRRVFSERVAIIPQTLLAADLDNDGREDLVGGWERSNFVDWYQATGDSAEPFWPSSVIATSSEPVVGLASSDLDGDGFLDLIVGLNGSLVWLQNLARFRPQAPPLGSAPVEGEVDVPILPTLQWDSVAEATHYELEIARDSTFEEPVVQDFTQSLSYSVSTELLAATTYYWRLRAVNEIGTGRWSWSYQFRTSGTVPTLAPNQSEPADGASGLFTRLVFRWDQIELALRYEVDLSKQPDFSVLDTNLIVSDTSVTVDGLANLSHFYWRVRGVNDVGAGPWSSGSSFSTNDVAGPPSIAPTLLSTQGVLYTRFLWTALDDATNYQLNLDVTDDFLIAPVDTGADTTYERKLSPLTTYFYRVRAENPLGIGPWSDTKSLTTGDGAIGPPTPTSPPEGGTISWRDVALEWLPPREDYIGFYSPQLSLSPTFDTFVRRWGTRLTSIQAGTLDPETTYYWRVHGGEGFSEAWSFTTAGELPPAPTGLEPLGDGAPLDPVLAWTEVAEIDFYEVRIDTTVFINTGFPFTVVQPVVSIDSIASTNVQATGLQPETQYYWRVRDWRGTVSSPWSVPLAFTTGAVGTGREVNESPAKYRLSQNYPNPFNPTTTISYDLPQAADVTLTVVDVLGRQIRQLASGAKPAGTYDVTFDATGLPSGIYFYRLQAGDYVETKRMVVVK